MESGTGRPSAWTSGPVGSFPLPSRGRLIHFQKWVRLPLLLQEAPLCPPLPDPRGPPGAAGLPEFHPASASLKLPARGKAVGPNDPGVPCRRFPVRGPASLSSHHPSLSSSFYPPPLPHQHPGRCPAPTAARKDAAWVPCQASECAAPPSWARNAAGPRGRRRHPALRPALSYNTGSQAGGLSSPGPGFLLEGKQNSLLFSQATKSSGFISKSASKQPYSLPKLRFETRSEIYFLKVAGVSLSVTIFLEKLPLRTPWRGSIQPSALCFYF